MHHAVIRSCLWQQWHLAVTELTALPTGRLSRAFAVTADGQRFVARLVDETARRPLEAGLTVADHLRGRGVHIGMPVRTLTGALTADTPVGTLSLLRRVPGRLLDGGDPVDQHWWGERLGTAHRALQDFDHCGLWRWNRLHPDAAHLAVEPWLRPAVTDAVAAMTRLTVTDRLTYGVLHGDPAPAGFVIDAATGRAGMLDWGSAGTGPLVYDIAAAVVYAGGPDRCTDFLESYLAAAPMDRDELVAALPVVSRFLWAVHADRLARALSAAGATATAEADGRQRAALYRALRALEATGEAFA